MNAKSRIKMQFMKEYSHRDFALITVKELCASVAVARTTFYSYYNNTDEVLSEIEDELIHGLLSISDQVSLGNYQEMDFIYLKGIPDFFIYPLIWMGKIAEEMKDIAIELGLKGPYTSFKQHGRLEYIRSLFDGACDCDSTLL